jgi:hypothetical protein
MGLPLVARWFFSRVGTDRSYRFVFGIAAFLVGGVLAEAAGIDAIVGAFFAGLGLNRAVPEESPLMERLQFMGSTLFIPIFLVSVGVLLEPRVLIDPKTLGIALVFTLAVLGGKALAAIIAGRTFKFSWAEVGVMSGLSGSQAAATLATTLVGAKLGLFDTQTINAVLVVILASLVVTPALVSAFGKRVSSVTDEVAALGKVVLVPVWGDSTQPALSLAGQLAASDGGIVLAASFADKAAAPAEVTAQRGLTSKAEEWLAKEGRESRTLFRIAPSVPEGLLETVIGEDATLLVSEWRTSLRNAGGSEASDALVRAPVPVLITHGDVARFHRLVIVLGADEAARADERGPALAAQIAAHFGHGTRIAAVAPAGGQARARARFGPKQAIEWIESDDPVGWIAQNLQDGDLPLFIGIDTAREALLKVPALGQGRFLVAQAAAPRSKQERAVPVTNAAVLAGAALRPRTA